MGFSRSRPICITRSSKTIDGSLGCWPISRLLELGHTFCVSAEIYKATITYYGRPDKLFPFPFLGASTAVGGALPFSPIPSSLSECLGYFQDHGAALGLLLSSSPSAPGLEEYRRSVGWMAVSLLSMGAAIDIMIATSMLFYLYGQREKVLARSVRLIDRLVQYTLCTGLLPSLSAVVMVIMYSVDPDSMIWLAIYTCLAKLYSNSVLASLNARATLRSTFNDGSSAAPFGRPTRANDPSQLVVAVEMKSAVTHDGQDQMSKSYDFEHA
ncbi:hypothetical protein CC2G_009803 [Coprinopsis cinerea AmutBmut pab1-1]|nr:hypothetical protein CC2G_009803 [Coprinopsis cinerea AmutBmut pab1-1]